MARSSYIYVLQCIDGGQVLACRTVKYELVGYLKVCGQSREILETHFQFLRFCDGALNPTEPFVYDWKDIP